jgi:hypothetical protein
MELKQELEEPINGYWNGGPKKVFYWRIDSTSKDSKGYFCKIGSWVANYWFHVAKGKTEKQTLSYAKQKLNSSAKKANIKATFSYVK